MQCHVWTVFSLTEACKYVCSCAYGCAPAHVDELEVEKIAFFFFFTAFPSQRAQRKVEMADCRRSYSCYSWRLEKTWKIFRCRQDGHFPLIHGFKLRLLCSPITMMMMMMVVRSALYLLVVKNTDRRKDAQCHWCRAAETTHSQAVFMS